MFYRESGQFKTSYAADQAIFPIKQDNWGMVLLLLLAFFAVPYFGTEYFFQAITYYTILSLWFASLLCVLSVFLAISVSILTNVFTFLLNVFISLTTAVILVFMALNVVFIDNNAVLSPPVA